MADVATLRSAGKSCAWEWPHRLSTSASSGQRNTVSVTVGLLDADGRVGELVLIGRAEGTPERGLAPACVTGALRPSGLAFITGGGAGPDVLGGGAVVLWPRPPLPLTLTPRTAAPAPERQKRTRSAAVHPLPGGEELGVRIPVAIAPSSAHRPDCGRSCPFWSAEPGPPGTHLQWRQRVGRQAPAPRHCTDHPPLSLRRFSTRPRRQGSVAARPRR